MAVGSFSDPEQWPGAKRPIERLLTGSRYDGRLLLAHAGLGLTARIRRERMMSSRRLLAKSIGTQGRTVDTTLSIFGWLSIVAVSAFGVWAVVIVTEAYYYQGWRARGCERDLGFEHGSAYPRCGGRLHLGILSIRALTPGGAFDRAGFKKGDLLPELSITDFFKLLHRGRGKEVELVIVEGGDGPSLPERPSRRVWIMIPPSLG